MAYHALRRLIKGEWWIPPTIVGSDDDGRIRVEGFAGRYRVRVGEDEALVDLEQPGSAERQVVVG